MVITDIKEERPRIWFGMRKGKAVEEPFGEEAYEVVKETEQFYAMGGKEEGKKEKSYLRYRVESGKNYEIGDTATFRGKAMTICEKKVSIKRGEIIYSYILSDPAGYSKKRRGNERLQGAGIEGKILERKEDSMRVHLSIDERQEKEKAWWYPYTPKSSNQFYAMPAEGEKVRLMFGDKEESKSYLRDDIRSNGESCPETGKPENRWYRTEGEKIMTLQPEQLQMSTLGNEMREKDNTIPSKIVSRKEPFGCSVGNCSEPKAAMAAYSNNSPITGMDEIKRININMMEAGI